MRYALMALVELVTTGVEMVRQESYLFDAEALRALKRRLVICWKQLDLLEEDFSDDPDFYTAPSVVFVANGISEMATAVAQDEQLSLDLEAELAAKRESMGLRGGDVLPVLMSKEWKREYATIHRKCRNGRRGPRPAQKPFYKMEHRAGRRAKQDLLWGENEYVVTPHSEPLEEDEWIGEQIFDSTAYLNSDYVSDEDFWYSRCSA